MPVSRYIRSALSEFPFNSKKHIFDFTPISSHFGKVFSHFSVRQNMFTFYVIFVDYGDKNYSHKHAKAEVRFALN